MLFFNNFLLVTFYFVVFVVILKVKLFLLFCMPFVHHLAELFVIYEYDDVIMNDYVADGMSMFLLEFHMEVLTIIFSELFGLTEAEFAAQTTANFNRLFTKAALT